MTKKSCAFIALCGCFVLGACASEDRDEDGTGGVPGDDGTDDGGDDGDAGDDGGDDGGGPDAGDDGTDDGDDGTSGGDDGTSGGDDGTEDGTGDDGGADTAPDCRAMWQGQYIPNTEYMTMKDPETAEEMFCYVNMERINYQFHGRNSGCIWSGGDGSTEVTWPYEMEYDGGLTASAQAAADAIAAGGQPPGVPIDGGYSNPTLWVDGCASEEYTVSAMDDDGSALSNSNGSARMGVHYYDPGPNSPTLTKLGVGMSKTGNLYNWVVKFGQ
jgi:hypothetical protein